MSRRGDPFDKAKAESCMKALKVGAVYLAAYGTFDYVTADHPRFINEVYNGKSYIPGLAISALRGSKTNALQRIKAAA